MKSSWLPHVGVVAAIVLAGAGWQALAEDAPPPPPPPAMQGGMPPGPPHPPRPGHPPGGPLVELGLAEGDQVASQAIADLSKAQLSEVQRVVRTWGVPVALRYFSITPETFRTSADTRLTALVRRDIQEGRIDPAQGAVILEQVRDGRAPRASQDADAPPPPMP